MQLKYVAIDKKGNQVVNFDYSESIPALITKLKSSGMLPVKVFEVKSAEGSFLKRSFFEKTKVTTKEVSVLTRQLAATLKAGLLLSEAIETVAEDRDNTYLQKVMMNIRGDIRAGSSFSRALLKYPKIFPPAYTSIIKSGEATGRLASTMEELAKYLENTERMKQKIKSAMQYPLFVFSFTIVVVLVVVFFLIPKFQDIYMQAGAQLPFFTRMVVSGSDFAVKYFLVLSGVVFLLVAAFKHSLKHEKFKYYIDHLTLKMPVFGKEIFNKLYAFRFCRTLGLLITGGVSIAQSLEITADVINNLVMKKAVIQVRSKVVGGSELSSAVKSEEVFPRLVTKMVSVGERSGQLDEMLDQTAEYYSDELDISIANMVSLVEPILIIVIGIFVGAIIIALYLPIFKVSTLVTM